MIAAWAVYAAGLALLLLLFVTNPPLTSLRRGVLWLSVAACWTPLAVVLMAVGNWLPGAIDSAAAVVAWAGWWHWRTVRKRAAA